MINKINSTSFKGTMHVPALAKADKFEDILTFPINTKDVRKIIPKCNYTEIWALHPQKKNDLHCYKVPVGVNSLSDVLEAYTAASTNPHIDIYI